MENKFSAKIARTVTSVLPVSGNREGKCLNCGECCKLPKDCFFLKYDKGKYYCSIHKIRPLNCRKYPRTEKEFITKKSCGYRFI